MRTEKATQMGRLAVPNGAGANNNGAGGKNAKKQTAGKRAIVTMNRNKKTTQILLIIAGTFAVCWLPYHLFMIISELDAMYELNLSLVNPQGVNYIFIGCHVIAMTTTITNPILYGWLNTNLKHLFRAMIPYLKQDRGELTVGAGGSSVGPGHSGAEAPHHGGAHANNNANPFVNSHPGCGGTNGGSPTQPLLAMSSCRSKLPSQSEGVVVRETLTTLVSRRSLPTEITNIEFTTVVVATDEEEDTVTSDGKAEFLIGDEHDRDGTPDQVGAAMELEDQGSTKPMSN